MGHLKEKEAHPAVRGVIVLSGVLSLLILGLAIMVATSGVMVHMESVKSSKNDSAASPSLPLSNHGMAANGATDGERAFFLSVPAVVNGCNIDGNRPDTKAAACKPSDERRVRSYSLLTTTASISAQKAIEFTLVGAKPSGTS